MMSSTAAVTVVCRDRQGSTSVELMLACPFPFLPRLRPLPPAPCPLAASLVVWPPLPPRCPLPSLWLWQGALSVVQSATWGPRSPAPPTTDSPGRPRSGAPAMPSCHVSGPRRALRSSPSSVPVSLVREGARRTSGRGGGEIGEVEVECVRSRGIDRAGFWSACNKTKKNLNLKYNKNTRTNDGRGRRRSDVFLAFETSRRMMAGQETPLCDATPAPGLRSSQTIQKKPINKPKKILDQRGT